MEKRDQANSQAGLHIQGEISKLKERIFLMNEELTPTIPEMSISNTPEIADRAESSSR
jgi:hypothetical protein